MFLQLSKVDEKIFEVLWWDTNAFILNLKRKLHMLDGLIWLWTRVYLVRIIESFVNKLDVSEDDSYLDAFSLACKLDSIWKKI